MADDLVMRSVYLPVREDNDLRQLAHELKVSKSDLIRSAIIVKLREWHEDRSRKLVRDDVQHGRRDNGRQPLPSKQQIEEWLPEEAPHAADEPGRSQEEAATPRPLDSVRARAQ